MADAWEIVPLDDSHTRESFSCGKIPLDIFLREQAGQYQRKGVGRTFVAVEPGQTEVIGYYTLAASSLPFETVPRKLSKKLPKHPVPVILIGRLAVALSFQGKGLGAELLMDAIDRILAIADTLGVYAVHVQAMDDGAQRFYEKYGFESLIDQDRLMILPMATIRKGI